MTVNINMIAVLLATLSSMIVGTIWYSRSVFGNTWAKLAGLKLDDPKMKKGAGMAIATTIVVSFITAYVLAHISFIANAYFHDSFLKDSVTTAFWLWLGFT